MIMKTKTQRFDICSIAPFGLFAVFSICVMSVLLLGTGLYQRQAERDLIGYQKRTVSQYITTRIRQSDRYDACFVGDFGSGSPQSTGDAFFFTETIGGVPYYTCMYCCDGYLYELFAAAEDSLDKNAGERILEVGSVYFVDNGQNITAIITHADGSVQRITVHLRCAGEGLS